MIYRYWIGKTPFKSSQLNTVVGNLPIEMNSREKSVLSLTMMTHGTLHVYELSIPLFITIWRHQFNASLATLGAVAAIGYGLFGVGAPPGGLLADKIGSKKLIVGCLAGMSLSFVALSFATNIWHIALALSLWGISASVYHPSGLSAITKEINNRGKALALHGIAGNIGIGLGPMFTTVLLLFTNWENVALTLAAPGLLFAAYGLKTEVDDPTNNDTRKDKDTKKRDTDTRDDTPQSFKEFLGTAKILFTSSFILVFAVAIMSGLYYRGITTFLPDLLAGTPSISDFTLRGFEIKPSRYIYSGLLTIGLLGQYTGGWITNRVDTELGILATYGSLGLISLVFIPVTKASAAILIVASGVLGFTIFVGQPLYQSWVAEYSPEKARGLSYGFTYFGTFGVGALGAAVTGIILTYANQTVLFAVLASIAFTASATGLYVYTKKDS